MRVGDWVKIIGTSGNKDRTGYILEVDGFANRFTVIQTVPWAKFEVAKLIKYKADLVLLDKDEVDEVNVDLMIDMALRTRDKEWFMELTSKFKRKK